MSNKEPLVLRTPSEMTLWSEVARARGERVAFVPTMGALHEGHVSLLREGRRRGDRLALSIFVNPTQFGPKEDLSRYPRDLPGDLAKAASAGTDVAYVPDAADVYPPGFQTYVQVRELEQGLCGGARPGHFMGVATVVCKLFNVVRPQVALFGEKDFQQLAVIRRMVTDLDLGVEIAGMPIVREPDGLAMSSRNAYLSPDERRRALALARALSTARARAEAGERYAAALVSTARSVLEGEVDRVDYVELRDATTLAPVTRLDREGVLLVAALVGKARLIDNVRLVSSSGGAGFVVAPPDRPLPD
ncbi:MAG TPA: pantoate--beta-alanine ligase [Polyangia bacterium]|nr:pantoate--beta-alanine ligase [Polyangia bacterium]